MSFRDNLLHLRAANNITQERLAVLLGVSRQAVTKWESEKSYPEMDKLIKMCQIFNCTLDELVQGDLTAREPTLVSEERPATPPVDVFDYDKTMSAFAWKIALGVAAIILGVALSMPLYGASDPATNPYFSLSENVAAALGTGCIFLGVVVGLALIIPASLNYSHFVHEHPYIEDFYTKEDKAKARSAFSLQIVGGIACIFVGVCAVMLVGEDSGNIYGVAIMLGLIALGVFFFIHGSLTLGKTNIAQYNLKASEYLEEAEIASAATIPDESKPEFIRARKAEKRIGAICGMIMIVATAIALVLLFVPLGFGGDYSSGLVRFFWLPWPIGGLMCGVVSLLIKGFGSE